MSTTASTRKPTLNPADTAQMPGVQLKDLLRPAPARRGVRAHAADRLSRLERRTVYLPI
jgi:hypothetical protein